MTSQRGRSVAGEPAIRVVAVADTDSYVKWAAALVADRRIDGELVVLDTEVAVSDVQLRAALTGSGLPPERARRASFADLPARLARADVVLAAARGPVARVVAREASRREPRPVIVSGLPGISVPATWRALHFRRRCDLMIVHSHREVREFRALAKERAIDQRFALATLPFARKIADADPAGRSGTDLVFAAQAIVPRAREDRRRVARILVETAKATPDARVVVKLRGRPGEHETHREEDGYVDLLTELGPLPANLVVSYEPMSRALDRAEGLVTVSSTAAIEAAARGIPVVALDTFGVDETLINTVFRGSGLLGTADDVIARRMRHPDPGWLGDNYFHDVEDDTWIPMLRDLVRCRTAGDLAPRAVSEPVGGALRDAWHRRLAIGSRDRTISGAVAIAIGVPARYLMRAVRALVRLRA